MAEPNTTDANDTDPGNTDSDNTGPPPSGPIAIDPVDPVDPADASSMASVSVAGLTAAGLTDGELIDLIQSTNKLVGYATSVQARAMSVLAQRSEPVNSHDRGFRGHEDISTFVADEISLACGISRQSGGNRLEVALALTERLPHTLTALTFGDIDFIKARIMSDETDRLTAAQAASVDKLVVQELTGPGKACSYRRWEMRIREAAAAIAPVEAEEGRKRALASRSVTLTPQPDGMSELTADLPAADAEAIYALVTRCALSNSPGDDRTLGQRRADAFIDLILGRATSTSRKPLIAVTVAATTLLGLDSQPAQLNGYGPITAEAARELAADGTWRRLLTDPASGTLLDYGTRLYRPPASMARHVRAAHQVCRFPGCDRAADSCDLDHSIAFPDGPTAAWNIGPKCRHDHRGKGETPWHEELLPDFSVLWISPTGHHWIDPPRPVLPAEPEPVDAGADATAPCASTSATAPTDDLPPF